MPDGHWQNRIADKVGDGDQAFYQTITGRKSHAVLVLWPCLR
jgi:hypothetical protein